MNLERVSAGLMEPGDDDNFSAFEHSIQTIDICRTYLKDSVRRAFVVKQRSAFPALDFRSNYSDRLNEESLHNDVQTSIIIFSGRQAFILRSKTSASVDLRSLAS